MQMNRQDLGANHHLTSETTESGADSPVFLVGSERSGTTLLRLMLDHHPDIAFNLESEFLVTHISDSGAFPDLATYHRKLAEDRVFRQSRFAIDEDLDFPHLVNDFLRQKRCRDGKRVVGATVHYGFRRLKFLWPNAKYIYLLRDGRDVAPSVVGMGWAGNDYVATEWWLKAESEWSEVRRELDRSRWLEVRYEDLTADAPGQLRRICEFIGVSYSERMFDYVRTSTYSWPDPSQNFKWRRTMRSRDVQLIEARIGPRLAERGYELSCGPPLRVSHMHDEWLRVQSRLLTLRHRIRTYGFWLVAAEIISRHLSLQNLRESARQAIHKIDDQNLK
jgi:Sulfotransferase family